MGEGFKKPKKESNLDDAFVKNIKTERQFLLWLQDAMVQFSAIKLVAENLSDDDLFAYTKSKTYLKYKEWLAKEGKKISLDDKELNAFLDRYDSLIAKLREFKTKEEYELMMKEFEDLYKEVRERSNK